MRILICDDNHDGGDTLAALCHALIPEAQIRVSYSGTECVVHAPEWRPDVLLLDIGMPGLSGYEVATHLRQLKECCDTFIIAISGWAAKADLARSKAAGIDLHFAKPINAENLLHLIRKGRPTIG